VTAQVPSLGAAAREVPVAPPGARTLLAADAAEADPGLFELELGVSPMMMAADAAPHPAPDPPSGAVPLTGPVLAAPALPATHAAPATGAPAAALAYAPAPPPASGRPPVILEITPRGLGIATVAGYCEELIRRNSRLPAAMKRVFTTSRDRQDLVRIVICQGESRRLEQNVVIGDLVLAGLPPRPRGETAIEVMFALDASGILQVRARDAQTGSEQAASLDLLGNIAQQDVAASRDRIQQLRR
jgi:molecular chaperone DnaK